MNDSQDSLVGGSLAVKSEGRLGVVECECVGNADVPPGIVVANVEAVSENSVRAVASEASALVTKLYCAAMIVIGGLVYV
jgi:hypothetical protein